MASRKRGVVEEPSTLVYTLLTSDIPFADFSLIIRGMHSYMVDNISADERSKTVTVKLGYQASVENAKKKLGKFINHVSINKLSSHVNVCEIPLLEQLKRKYGLPILCDQDDNGETTKKRPTKKPRYKASVQNREEDSESEHE